MKSKIIVKGNQIQKFPITVYEINRDNYIYGPQVATLKGESTQNVQVA